MNDPDKIDFGPLDPSQDEARWHQLVAQTTRRAREHQARRVRTVAGQLVDWGRPAFALAAALSLFVWSAASWRQGRMERTTQAATETEQAAFLLSWALNDEVPPPEVLLQVTGASDGDE
jgi:hypothetical protein